MPVEEPAEPQDDLVTRADIARNVRTLMENRGVSLAEVAEAINVSKSSASQRLHAHTPFKGEQLIALATLLRVEVAVFFLNPDELLRSRCLTPELRVVEPGPGQLVFSKVDPPAELSVISHPA